MLDYSIRKLLNTKFDWFENRLKIYGSRLTMKDYNEILIFAWCEYKFEIIIFVVYAVVRIKLMNEK